MSMSVLEFSGVTKRYGRVTALCDLSLKVEPGEGLGLVGPNGAGKSTVLKLGVGLLRPTAGRVAVRGKDPWRDPDARRRVGYLPEQPALYPELRVRELVALVARLHGLALSRSEVEAQLERVGLAGRGGRRARQLSKGQRQRLSLACALICDPDVLLLDEPVSGLDPQGVRAWQRLLQGLKEEGHKTIVLASHRLDVIEALCDRVAVLRGGRLLAHATLETLRQRALARVSRVRVELREIRPELIEALERWDGLREVERNGHALVVRLRSGKLEERAALARRLLEAGGELLEFTSDRPSLDELLDEGTGSERKEVEADGDGN